MKSLSRAELLDRATQLSHISTEFEFRISSVASEGEVKWRQKQVDRTIPSDLSEFALSTASRIHISWQIDVNKVPDVALDGEYPDCGTFEFNFYKTDLSDLEGWEDSFTNWEDYCSERHPFEYEELFPVFDVGNGDLIVSMIGEHDPGAIYYLDHEGGSGNWKRLANSYCEFLNTLHRLWFPGMEWHGCLELFYDHARGIVSAETESAKKWDAFLLGI